MTTKQPLDQHDKQISAIRSLVKEGMRLVIETRKDMRALAAAQKTTDPSLRALIDTMRGDGNGYAKRRVDLN